MEISAKQFDRLSQLINTLDTDCKAKTSKFDEIFGGFQLSYFYLTANELVEMIKSKENFLKYWQISDERKYFVNMKCESCLKSNAYKNFVEKYKHWSSGYSMGEKIDVVLTIKIGEYVYKKCDIIADYREKYRGKAKKWNGKIKYGSATLNIVYDNNKKMKSSIYVINKK